MTVLPEVEKIMRAFHRKKKYIALSCIAPILVAKIFGTKNNGPGLGITLGHRDKEEGWPYAEAVDVGESFGNEMVFPHIDGVCHDNANKIVTAPVYMYDGTPVEIFESVRKMPEVACHHIMKRRILINPVIKAMKDAEIRDRIQAEEEGLPPPPTNDYEVTPIKENPLVIRFLEEKAKEEEADLKLKEENPEEWTKK